MRPFFIVLSILFFVVVMSIGCSKIDWITDKQPVQVDIVAAVPTPDVVIEPPPLECEITFDNGIGAIICGEYVCDLQVVDGDFIITCPGSDIEIEVKCPPRHRHRHCDNGEGNGGEDCSSSDNGNNDED